MTPPLTLVSNRLPIRVNSKGIAERTTGGLASALAGAGLESDYLWIGWSGSYIEENSEQENYVSTLRSAGVEPVILSKEDVEDYYDGYSSATLWPLLHQMVGRARFEPKWIESYRSVNQQFAQVIAKKAPKQGSVWIHDYHLMLLPSLLRELRPDLKIGFFLHTPFPSSEIFRALPEKVEMLEGLLGADLIGFHTYNYLRHFSSSLLRILGLEGEPDGIWQDNRHVKFGVYPIGHNSRGFREAMQSKGFSKALQHHSESLIKGKLILSVERLDYTKGFPQKLKAIRHFLHTNPELRNQVNFVLIAVPSRGGVEAYDELTERVQREVGAINGDYGQVGHSPVQFLHRSYPIDELAALYALADVCMVTPTVDGMNLVAKEYIDCKRRHANARAGVLILSEFAGAAQEMSHALLVNPHDTIGVGNSIKLALDMSAEEKWVRVRAMQDRLARNDAGAWARRFLSDLETSQSIDPNNLPAESLSHAADNLIDSLKHDRSVAIFLDYDGTLREFTSNPADALPDKKLQFLLKKISSHPRINLAIISGRPMEFLQQHFGHQAITLVAEHGYYWKRYPQADWELMDPRVDNSWKELILPHLEAAVTLTPGAEVEVKHSSIVWHYRQADPEFGAWRARGLLSELTSITASLPVSVHHGQKIVEVASQLVNKGIAVDQLIRQWNAYAAIAVGDDQTDEAMFAIKPQNLGHYHTIKVGAGATRAEHRTTTKGVRSLLEHIVKYMP